MSASRLMSVMRNQGAMAAGQAAVTKMGEITTYNPSAFAVKVSYPPDETETGWIPLGSPWVGNGWGMFCAPSIGDQIEIEFQDGAQNAPVALLRVFDAQNAPLNVPSGEFWLVHAKGQFIKLVNDGSISINGNVFATGNIKVNGNMFVDGNLGASSGVSGTLMTSTGQVATYTNGILTGLTGA
jgi:phage baseplate assembly protein gpV